MIGLLYTALLFVVGAYVAIRGEWDGQIVAGTLLLGSINTYLLFIFWGRSFLALQLPLLLNEFAVLGVLLAVSVWSKRFWPIPVASCQVAAFLSMLTPYFAQNIVSHGLGVAQGIWAYPQLILVTLGTLRGANRRIRHAKIAKASPATAD